MKKSASAPARALAAIAVVGGFVIVLVLIGAAISDSGDDSSGGGAGHHGAHHSKQAQTPTKHVPASYEIQSGDTLVSIAHASGVPVATIERLNPGVDPQLLIAGEKLKLR
jgi:LysM repeat protein